MAIIETILVHSQLCTGCRACELACGFRRTKQMNPSQASIVVRRDDHTGKIEVKIHANCDVCQEREIPMCIQVCNPRALSLGRRLAQTLTQADKSSGEES